MILSLAILKRIARLLPSRRRQDLLRAIETSRAMATFASPAPTALRLALRPRLRILAYPDKPSTFQAFFKLCAFNGYRVVTDPAESYDLAIHFAYQAHPCRLSSSIPVINRRCSDVSKDTVARLFEQTFGYALAVDPLVFDGRMVEKPRGNYTHDGRILQGPLCADQMRSEHVYQRFIDTTDGKEAVDLRVPIYGGRIPIAYEKRRLMAGELKDWATARIRRPEEALSIEERDRLVAFADAIGLDYGEVDVLRDISDGRIYVVDVNNTPAGPPKQMSRAEITEALRILSPAFTRLVESVRKGARWRPEPGAPTPESAGLVSGG